VLESVDANMIVAIISAPSHLTQAPFARRRWTRYGRMTSTIGKE
jgi:hypothetical protein